MADVKTTDASLILNAVGGAENIAHLTHCATRLRFELVDGAKVDKVALDKIKSVLGVVPQGGNRLQIVIGGGVAEVYSQIMNLPEMTKDSNKTSSNEELKAAIRASSPRSKIAWIDAFFEYLSDSFRPILGILLGASLIIATAAVLDALKIVDFRAADKAAGWVFIDSMWHTVFFFLPLMVAYNAAKKLKVDPWLGTAVMGALMTPEFTSLANLKRFPTTVCVTNEALNTTSCTAHIFGIPMPLNDYSGNVFVPLIMAAVLALVYRGLKKIFPENIQMVFVPFFSLLIMVPVTAMLIGPFGIYLGNTIGTGLAWLNNHAPIFFAVLIPMLYPFLVPLGLHWPLNALMLANIDALGYDFIQGPMGSWNFACFGATAGVLYLSIREKDSEMRQTATGALAAGLLGGISEPSLYGIHLRFKRIYPRMLVGCLVGGVITGILGGIKTNIFAFTSVLTIPVFTPMAGYAIAVTAAFFTSMTLIIISGYKDKEPKAAELATAAEIVASESGLETSETLVLASEEVIRNATPKEAVAQDSTSTLVIPTPIAANDSAKIKVLAPVAGEVLSLDEVSDPVFSCRALGEGLGIKPSEAAVKAPISGVLSTVHATGHAYGILSDDGVELLIHIGVDTVKLNGEPFAVKVAKGDKVSPGDLLVDVDFAAIRNAGLDETVLMTVVNTDDMKAVTPKIGVHTTAGEIVIEVETK